jgi:hypothetical protein
MHGKARLGYGIMLVVYRGSVSEVFSLKSSGDRQKPERLTICMQFTLTGEVNKAKRVYDLPFLFMI